MRIFAFVRRYPIPYKPYYDAQFADFVRRGHDLTIFAGGSIDHVLNEKVTRHDLTGRTRHFPMTLRDLPGKAATLCRRLLAHPLTAMKAAAHSMRVLGSGERRLVHAARALSLGSVQPDFCLIHGLGTAVMFPWLKDVFPDVPVAMYYHGGEVPSSNPLEEKAAARAFHCVDQVFTNTEFSRQHAIERGCPPDRIMILPVGFDLGDFAVAKTRSYRPDGTLRLLSAGRMSEEKGFIYALQALKSLIDQGVRDIRYSLTGEDYMRPILEEYVRENRMEPYVNFLGTLSTEGVIQAMENNDALLLPSIQVGNWVENQACAVQEAMLMKALVITTKTGGVPESIPPEMQRFTAAEKDVAGLTRAIAAVHALSIPDLQRLGEAGRAFVTRDYEVGTLNDRLIGMTRAAASMRSLSVRPGLQELASLT